MDRPFFNLEAFLISYLVYGDGHHRQKIYQGSQMEDSPWAISGLMTVTLISESIRCLTVVCALLVRNFLGCQLTREFEFEQSREGPMTSLINPLRSSAVNSSFYTWALDTYIRENVSLYVRVSCHSLHHVVGLCSAAI